MNWTAETIAQLRGIAQRLKEEDISSEQLLAEILNKFKNFQNQYDKNLHISLDTFLKIPMIFHLDYIFDNFTKQDIQRIKTSFNKVLNDFIESRKIEGRSIQSDLLFSLDIIMTNLKLVEKEASYIEKEIINRYRERIKKFLNGHEIEERRIVQEAAVAADKVCINEEINRLKTHSKRLRNLLRNNKVSTRGREADFLSQEMQRETYTIASKTTSMDIHENILGIRREIEKIRQQVQNVE